MLTSRTTKKQMKLYRDLFHKILDPLTSKHLYISISTNDNFLPITAMGKKVSNNVMHLHFFLETTLPCYIPQDVLENDYAGRFEYELINTVSFKQNPVNLYSHMDNHLLFLLEGNTAAALDVHNHLYGLPPQKLGIIIIPFSKMLLDEYIAQKFTNGILEKVSLNSFQISQQNRLWWDLDNPDVFMRYLKYYTSIKITDDNYRDMRRLLAKAILPRMTEILEKLNQALEALNERDPKEL